MRYWSWLCSMKFPGVNEASDRKLGMICRHSLASFGIAVPLLTFLTTLCGFLHWRPSSTSRGSKACVLPNLLHRLICEAKYCCSRRSYGSETGRDFPCGSAGKMGARRRHGGVPRRSASDTPSRGEGCLALALAKWTSAPSLTRLLWRPRLLWRYLN